jgi:hypothetical protein
LPAVALSALPVWSKLLLCLLVLASAWLSWREEIARGGTILREQATDWLLETNTGAVRAVLAHQRIWRCLVVLDFRVVETGRRYRLVIFPDSVSADIFRRLRVRLRHAALPHDT